MLDLLDSRGSCMQDVAVLEVFLLWTSFKSYWMLADPSPLEG